MVKVRRPKEAYVRDKISKKYEVDPQTKLPLLVTIDNAIRIRTDNKPKHDKREYMSLHKDPDRRYRVRVVDYGENKAKMFARYGDKSEITSEFDQNFDESMSHRLAVKAISSLTSMRFFDEETNLNLEFDFEDVLREPFLKLPNGAIYYPDILCTFDETHEMYDKWGGKLAIEVTYTHECESYKKEDFMFHNIPVIEVVIEDKSSRQFPAERSDWKHGDNWNKNLENRHLQSLIEWFSQGIGAKLIVDPISTRAHKMIQAQFMSDMKNKQQEIIELTNMINVVNSDKNKLNKIVSEKSQQYKDFKRASIDHHDNLEEQLSLSKASLSQKSKEFKTQLEIKSKTSDTYMKISTFLVVFIVLSLGGAALFPHHAAKIISSYLNIFV
tara:strand:- start:13463 stop:14614 length:1152 start_codon:yes stop_codon:yes gene_type:complete